MPFFTMFLLSSAFSLYRDRVYTQTVAALLAVIGYSVNDTVVIYDRVREHEEKEAGMGTLGTFINKAANETLSRTVLTLGQPSS